MSDGPLRTVSNTELSIEIPAGRFLSVPTELLLAVLLTCIPLTRAYGAETSSSRSPNILIIVGDDMGYADVGFHRCADIPTPNLDQLAAEGVQFSNAYVTGPYCSPTRAGLMTGRYQQRFGHEFNPGRADAGMPVTEVTLADRLQKAGYATALVGKWHLGSQPQFHPQQRGFQEFFGFLGGAHDYFSSDSILRGQQPVAEKEYLTDAIAREGCRFIREERELPWFLCLTFNAVHTPMQADDVRMKRFESVQDKSRRTYAAMMSAMDDAVGRVRRTLDETEQTKNTLIIFFSDNGGPTMPGVTVNASRNTPLRGSKRTTLEGGIRVPFVMTWPEQFTPRIYSLPVIQLDATATALAAAGISDSDLKQLDGISLQSYLNGRNPAGPHDALFWRFGEQMAIRMGDYKLVRYDRNADTLTGDRNQGVTSAKLYDLSNDIGETKDLSAGMPDKAQELQDRWDSWNAGLVEPLWSR
jgi:arylsulfatase A-like enzyme